MSHTLLRPENSRIRGGGKTDGLIGHWLRHAQTYGAKAKGIVFRVEYAQMQNLPEHMRKAWLEGDWDVAAGGYLAGVWDPARHVVAPFLPPAEWPRWRAMDWGYRRTFSNRGRGQDHCWDELRYAVTARVTLSKQDLARASGGTPARRRPVLLDDLPAGRGPKDVDLYELLRRR